mgnify:CR=1 FL=1
MQKARHPEGIESLFKNYRMKVILKNPKSIQELQNEGHSEEPKVYSRTTEWSNSEEPSLFKNRKSIQELQNEGHSEEYKVCSRVESLFKISKMNVILENRKSVRKREGLIKKHHSKQQKVCWTEEMLSWKRFERRGKVPTNCY